MKNKISIICGTRPQLIKLELLLLGIKNDYRISVINTNQHYSNELVKYFDFSKHKDILYCNCPAPIGNPNQQIAKMINSIDKELLKIGLPDAMIVLGDTNSTLAGAIVASKLSIPLIHIEAGVRSFDLGKTEEQNRVITDNLSSLLLCPTMKSVENLKASKNQGKIIFSGDLLLDLFLASTSMSINIESLLDKIKFKSSNYSLLSLHRKENTGDNKILNQILKALSEVDNQFIFLVHPRIKSLLRTVKIPDNVMCTKPLSYNDSITLQMHAQQILTDSGGIAREAYFSGIPVGVLRDNFEWHEIIFESASNKLIGTTYESIRDFIEAPKNNYKANFGLFGEGKAIDVISQELKNFFINY